MTDSRSFDRINKDPHEQLLAAEASSRPESLDLFRQLAWSGLLGQVSEGTKGGPSLNLQGNGQPRDVAESQRRQGSQRLSSDDSVLIAQGPRPSGPQTDSGNDKPAARTTKEELTKLGIWTERMHELPMPWQLDEMREYLNASSPEQRKKAVDALQAKCASQRNSTPNQKTNVIHAQIAFEQVCLMEAALKLAHAQAACKRLANDPQAKKEELEAVRTLVQLEGKTASNATPYLNRIISLPTIPDGSENGGKDSLPELVKRARIEADRFALSIESPITTRILSRRPTPEEYALALERLHHMAAAKNNSADATAARFMLGNIQDNELHQYLKLLREKDKNGMPSTNAKAALIEVDAKIVRNKNLLRPDDLLCDIDSKDLNTARSVEREAKKALLAKIVDPLEAIVTRQEQNTASAATREECIKKIKGHPDAGKLKPLIEFLEVADSVLSIHESKSPAQAESALRRLLSLANGKADGGQPNVHAATLIAHLGGSDNVKRSALLLSLPSESFNAQSEWRNIKQALPKSEIFEAFDDYKVRCITIGLGDHPTAADLDRLVQRLVLLMRNNSFAQDMIGWAKTEAELRRIKESANDGSVCDKALKELCRLGSLGNRYAIAALENCLLASECIEHVNDTRTGNGGDLRTPLTPISLSQALTGDQVKEVFTVLAEVPAQTFSRHDYAAIALAISGSLSQTVNEPIKQAREALRVKLFNGLSGTKKADAMAGIVDAIEVNEGLLRGTKQEKLRLYLLSQAYLSAVDNQVVQTEEFDQQFQVLKRVAKRELSDPDDQSKPSDKASLAIVSGLAAGKPFLLNDEQAKKVLPTGDKHLRFDDGAERVVRDAQVLIQELARDPTNKQAIALAMLSGAEPVMDEAESFYDPKNFRSANRLAELHDFLSASYGQCGWSWQEKSHRCEAKEIRRVRNLLKAIADQPDKGEAIYEHWMRLPKDVHVQVDKQSASFSVSKNGFAQILESVPAFRVNQQLREALTGIDKMELVLGEVPAENSNSAPTLIHLRGKSTITVPGKLMGKPGLDVAVYLDNVKGEIVPDPQHNVLTVKGIKGLTIWPFDLLNELTISLDESNAAQPMLKVAWTFNKNLPGAPQNEQSAIVALSQEQSALFAQLVAELRKQPSERDLRKLCANAHVLVGGEAGSQEFLKQLLDGVLSVSRDGNTLKAKMANEKVFESTGLKVHLNSEISANIDKNDKCLRVSQIEGLSVQLPLPPQLIDKLGLEKPVKVLEARLEPPNRQGRLLTFEMDHPRVRSISVQMDANLQPAKVEGKQEFHVNLKSNEKDLRVKLLLLPEQIAEKGFLNADWKVVLEGDAQAKKALMIELGIPDAIADGIKDVAEVERKGGTISIKHGYEGARIKFGGVAVELGRNTALQLTTNKTEEGSSTKIKLEGAKVVDLPLDQATKSYIPGRIPFDIQQLTVETDENGQVKKVTIDRASKLIRHATFSFDAKGKPIFGSIFMENPAAPKARRGITISLKPDADGNLALSDTTDKIVLETAGGVAEHLWEHLWQPSRP